MAQQNQYAYADESFRRIVIAETELHLRGTYSGLGTYAPRDTIDYGDAKYIALISVYGTAPEGNHSDFWSILSLVQTTPPNPNQQLEAEIAAAQFTADSALSGAQFGIYLSNIGTNAGTNALLLAQTAYSYALQGTSAAQALAVAQSGTARADEAYYLATQGTNGANFGILLAGYGTTGVEQLYPIATSGTAGASQAYALAMLGTTLAGDAIRMIGTLSPVDQGARDVAYSGTAGVEQVFPIAVSGTAGAEQAFYLATEGTNGANFAIYLASQGTSGANAAFDLAVTGTNAAANALNEALLALSIASTGTTIASDAGNLALAAYLIAINGTNGVAQVYPVAASGTAGANAAYFIATSGTSGANSAYSLAQLGTNLAGYILTQLGTTLGLAGQGTASLYVAQLPNARADMRLIIQNGIITGFGTSLFSIENFSNYNPGTIGYGLGEMAAMSAWFGTAAINGWTTPVNSNMAFIATDTMQAYTPGTVFSTGTLLAGTYWTTAWSAGSISINLTNDDFTASAYPNGTVTTGVMSGGIGWLATGAFI